MKPIALLLLFLPGIVPAQSPYRTGWDIDGPLAGTAAALTAAMVIADRDLPGLTEHDLAALSRDAVNRFDRGTITGYSPTASNISTGLEYALMLAPAALLADRSVRDDLPALATLYGEVLVLSAVIPRITKGAIDRPRPFVYDPRTSLSKKLEPDARRSLFSQHATFSFASAVFLSTVYQDYFPNSPWAPWLWAGSLGMAGVVSLLRVTSGMHFPTDVLLGAAVGSAIGFAIPALHRNGSSPLHSTLVPTPGGAVLTLRLPL